MNRQLVRDNRPPAEIDAEMARQYFTPPLRFQEAADDSRAACIVDARGQYVAMLMWPGHTKEETPAAEQATYALGRLMAASLPPEPLCPHGMPLADNVCGPCSEGKPNSPRARKGDSDVPW